MSVYYDIPAEDQVKNLPNTISSVQSSSGRINQINVKHVTRHEVVVSYYVNDIKIVNFNITEKLKELCSATEEQIASANRTIDNQFETFNIQDSFSSAEQFKTIWSSIQSEVDRILTLISDMECEIIKSCEHARIDCIKQVMTHYFDLLKSAGVWDDRKLVSFFDNDQLYFNIDLLENYRRYATIASNMKNNTLFKLLDYRRNWEKHLLGWRDFLVQKNLCVIQEMLQSDEFTKSKEIEMWRSKAFDEMKNIDDLIIDSYKEMLRGLPYISKRQNSFQRKITEMLQNKKETARIYLDKATIHFQTLIKKIEQKLSDIKEVLFREASFSEEQFQKSFSKFINDGNENYEKIANEALNMDEAEIKDNLDAMDGVHSYMMQLLLSVSEAWGENAEQIKNHRKELLNDLTNCRDHHNGSSKITEREIDKILDKISEVSSSMKLDKLLERVAQKLNELKQKLDDLFSRMESLILAYPQRCSNQSSLYESSLLRLISLKRISRNCTDASLLSDQSSERDEMNEDCYILISGQTFEQLHAHECNPTITSKMLQFHDDIQSSLRSQIIIKELMEIASQVIVDHISLNTKNYKETYEILILKLQNEIAKEEKVRTDVHYPREKLIYAEFELRKKELDKFKYSFKQLYLCFDQFETKLTDIEKDFTNDASTIITSIEEAIEKACKKQLLMRKSKELSCHNTKFMAVLWNRERKISDKAKIVLSRIDKDAKVMRETEEKFMKYAKSGNFECGEKSKYFLQFCERRDQARNMTMMTKRNLKHVETQKNKKNATAIQNYKTHYKHCLLDLFFLEMKSSYLSKVRMQIKIDLSDRDTALPTIKDQLKDMEKSIAELDITQPDNILKNVQGIASSFTALFGEIKSLINFYNFRCSPISVPTENSLDQINQLYKGFSAIDPSIEDTIEFTKNILQLTSSSCKNENIHNVVGLIENSDDNWVADSANIENKYLSGKITCVYGVGANILDVSDQPWTSTSTAKVSVNSFWLSKNPEGLEALKGLKTEKKIRNSLGGLTAAGQPTQGETSGSKLKEVSNKIRNLVARTKQSQQNINDSNEAKPSQQNITDSASSPQKLPTITDSEIANNLSSPISHPAAILPKLDKTGECNGVKAISEKNNAKKYSVCELPTIPASMMKPNDTNLRNGSFNQMNMAKVMNLNKTVDLLSRTSVASRQKRTTCFNRQQNTPIYDFLIMTDDELKTFVFDPLGFFNLEKRKYNVSNLCENIVSITEKVKFYLLHFQEDFIISCLLFYRQRHLSIKYRQRMKLNHVSAIRDFTKDMKKYLENVHKQCDDRVQKIKVILSSMYDIFLDAPLITLDKILLKYKNDFTELFDDRLYTYQNICQETNDAQKKLSNALRPYLTHPQNEADLSLICLNEEKLSASKELETCYEESIKVLSAKFEKFEYIIKSCCEAFINAAESAIQIEDIRRMNTKEGSTFEVHKRLRQNLVVTTSQSPQRARSNSAQVNLVNYLTLHGTISKLSISVQKERDRVLTIYRKLHSCKTKEFSSYHLESSKIMQNWHMNWTKSICEIKALKNSNC